MFTVIIRGPGIQDAEAMRAETIGNSIGSGAEVSQHTWVVYSMFGLNLEVADDQQSIAWVSQLRL
jgi:hypothetical protein